MASFNKVLLGKLAWILAQNQNSLWSRIVKGVYFPNRSFLQVERESRPSWGWQSILHARETISRLERWSIGNGEMVNIREDRWLKRGIIGGPTNKNDPLNVSELILTEKAEWNTHKVNQLFDEDIAMEILSIPLSPLPFEDKLRWTKNQTGNFSVKSAYNSIGDSEVKQNLNSASTSFQQSRRLWNGIWKANIPPKVRIFIWSIAQNALPSRDHLFRRNIISHPLCPICNQQAETTDHILLCCPLIQQIWEQQNDSL